MKKYEEIPKKLEYDKLPKDIEKVVTEERAEIIKEASVTWDGRQFLVRFPKKISEGIELNKEDRIRFKLTLPKPRTQENPILNIEVVRT